MSWLVAIKELIILIGQVFKMFQDGYKKIDRATWDSNKKKRAEKRKKAWEDWRNGVTEGVRDLFRH